MSKRNATPTAGGGGDRGAEYSPAGSASEFADAGAPTAGELLNAINENEDTFFTQEEEEITDRVNHAVAYRRLILFLLGFIQCVFLEVPAFILSVTNAELTSSIIDICRLVYCLIAMVVSFHAINYLLARKRALHHLRQMLWLRWFALAFETTLFALQGTDFLFFVYFGIGNLFFSILSMIIGFTTTRSIGKITGARDSFGYAIYLKAVRYGKDTVCLGDLAKQMSDVVSGGFQQGEGGAKEEQRKEAKKKGFDALVSAAWTSAWKQKKKKDGDGAGADDDAKSESEEDFNVSSDLVDFVKPGYTGPDTWKRWFVANKIREVLLTAEVQFHRNIRTLLFALIVFTIGNITYEFLKIFSQQQPLLDDTSNAKANSAAHTKGSYFPNRTHTNWKVHLVVIDGLRDDMTANGASSFGDYINSGAFKPFSMKFKATAQLPSFSVPNWMSILTGTTPEINGVTGNLLASETSFDHIFRSAQKYGLHTGMTGTPWWKTLVFSTLPELDGDGTVDASYVPEDQADSYSWLTSNPADEERLEVAVKAVTRSIISYPFGPNGVTNLYDFFLTHFSDVDKQGHEYGVDSTWNTANTYQGAIDNKTKALQQIVAAIDNKTVLIVTSDHGHVKRGGHGGVSEILREVPLLFYAKGTPLNGNYTPTVFPANEEPRLSNKASAGGATYSNLDISGTICALLGIPSPRQSLGIMVEEALLAFIPDAPTRSKHYHDLYRGKRSAVQQFADYVAGVSSAFFTDLTQDAAFTSASASKLFNAAAGTTDRAYGDGVRELLPLQSSMRNQLYGFTIGINLVGSLLLWGFFTLMVIRLFNSQGGTRLVGFGHPGQRGGASQEESSPAAENQLRQMNVKANLIAMLTVFFYFVLVIVGFVVGYFAVIGYSVWDSTLAHTTTAATPFLAITITTPVCIFIVLNKMYLAAHIDWNSRVISIDLNAGKKMSCSRLMRWLIAIGRDFIIFFTATSKYHTRSWPAVYLYSKYMCMWTLLLSGVLLFIAFPFTTAVPVVLSTPFVDEFNLEYRFRVMTLWIMICPLQIGTWVLLWMEPDAREKKHLAAWDLVWMKCYLSTDLAAAEDWSRGGGGGEEEDGKSVARKYGTTPMLIHTAIRLLQDPELSVSAEDLSEATFFRSTTDAAPAPLSGLTPSSSPLLAIGTALGATNRHGGSGSALMTVESLSSSVQQ